MSTEAPSPLHGLSIAEKISRLTAFIADDLDARAATGMHATGACYLLIARSAESPVAQALRAHADRMSSMGIRVRTIFSEIDQTNGAHLAAPFALPSECRIARDSRLLAAHEQLVLTPTRTWLGDCMRREPGKRDAFERYANDCAQTGAHATRSFESLWRITTPLVAMPSIATLTQMSNIATAAEKISDDLHRQ
ncbi:MAG TPA: hypothetical protein VNR88_15280 [Hyphomicrobium sp.]|nr:hypothetical protein [Hyphomicrobium sp.]